MKCLAQTSGQSIKVLTVPEPQQFTYDAIAGESVDQEGVFQGAHPGLKLLSVVQAQNSGFAGSGLTFASVFSSCGQATCRDRVVGLQFMHLCVWADRVRQNIHNAGKENRGPCQRGTSTCRLKIRNRPSCREREREREREGMCVQSRKTQQLECLCFYAPDSHIWTT